MKKGNLSFVGVLLIMGVTLIWFVPIAQYTLVSPGYIMVGWWGSVVLDPNQVVTVQNTDIRPLCFTGQSDEAVFPGEKIALENLRSTTRRVVNVSAGFPFLPWCPRTAP